MATKNVSIRDLRESKNISQDKAAEAAGLSYSKFVRIEEGSGKTTQEEVDHVLGVLKEMEAGTRKMAGRPFKDPARQAAVVAARAAGTSVSAALGVPAATTPPKAPAAAPKKAAAKAPESKDDSLAKALAKKAPARARGKAKAAEETTSTDSVSSLLP